MSEPSGPLVGTPCQCSSKYSNVANPIGYSVSGIISLNPAWGMDAPYHYLPSHSLV